VTTEQAEVSQGRKISSIWFIPLLALALGVYMVVHNWMTEGPEIEIAFKTATGLAQGKTKVKYRNVDMGLVEEVRLNDDFDGVIAKVKLDRQVLPLLREDTRFWVVTARIGAGSISGLDTLLSGAYIQLAPGSGKAGARKFVALGKPPLTPNDAPGLRLQLTSDHASSVSAGDTLLYKGYKVGRVESMEFSPSDRKVRYVIFVDAPYHELVNSATRFWDVSGISLSAGADGFRIETGSVDTVLLGGVAFDVPEGLQDGDPVEPNTDFRLYTAYEEILKNPYRHGTYYVVSFNQSIRGLSPGAPVEFRGITIGRVERILLKEVMQRNVEQGLKGKGTEIPVLVYLEPARLALPDSQTSIDAMHESIAGGVTNGMRASLASGSILTGAKYINIDYFEGVEEASLGSFMEYTTIPTLETGLGQLEQKLTAIMDKINNLPLEDTVGGANEAIATLNETLGNLNTVIQSQGIQQLPQQLDQTLQDLRKTLNGLAPGSEVYQSINSALLRLNRTLGNLEKVTNTLADQPNSLILPSNYKPDPVPETKK
jgi:paraquat-inducible protein B